MKKSIGVISALTLGLGLALAGPTAASAGTSATIYVPDDFLPKPISDTRSTGHYQVEGTGLHIWTDGQPSSSTTNKVAEYVATSTPLAAVGEPRLDYTNNAGVAPGFQLIVDVDGINGPDGILVGETVYNGDWWLSGGSAVARAGAPSVTPEKPNGSADGNGGPYHGTLNQWRIAFPNAQVVAFGFSLGSGVAGDGVINAIEFAGTTYTFAEHTVLASKDECKNGGWATSTKPVFKNQGQCVSSFASKNKLSNFAI